jgi:hypothetical protein
VPEDYTAIIAHSVRAANYGRRNCVLYLTGGVFGSGQEGALGILGSASESQDIVKIC